MALYIEIHESLVLKINLEYIQLLLQSFLIQLKPILQTTDLYLNILSYTAILFSKPIFGLLSFFFNSTL